MNRFCLLLAALLVCGPKPAAGSQEPPEPDLSASGILEESRMAGSQLPPWERAFHLGRLIHAAQRISPETAADWAEELFWLTFALPRTWNRGALQKNAVAELARLRPERAWELFDLMDAPAETEGGIPEDLRASAAETLFRVYWEKHRSQDAIEAVRLKAAALARSGQYPYRAVSPILEELLASDPVQAAAWVAEMQRHYEQGARIAGADEEFAELLLSFARRLPKAAARSALQTAVRRLRKAGPDRAEGVFRGEADTSAGVFPLRRRQEIWLLRLMPLLKELDPPLAKELAEESPALRAARETDLEVRSIREATVLAAPGSGTPALPAAIEIGEAQQSLEALQRAFADDAGQAVKMAWRIRNPAVREEAFAWLARSVATGASAKGEAALRSLAEAPASEDDPELQLNLATLRAVSAKAAGKADAAWAAAEEAFELGESLTEAFLAEHPAASVQEAPALASLSHLTRILAAMDPVRAVFRLRRLNSVALRAYLLAEAAQALADRSG